MINMWPCKNISHPSLLIYFFATPPIRLKLQSRITNRWKTTKNKLPWLIIMIIQFVATLALGLWLKQGLAKVQANSEA
jgi:hypothetical protein